jgi:electron transfer flavoprotein alpha subunit
MKALLIVEHDQHTIKSIAHYALHAAMQLASEIDILLMGPIDEVLVQSARQWVGVTRVLLADNDCYEHHLPENCAALIADLGQAYDYILTGATTFGKNILPRVAALLDVAMLSDVIKIISADTFVRPMYAGNVLSTVQLLDRIKILTIRSTAFDARTEQQSTLAPLELIEKVIPNQLARFESQSLTETMRPELTTARVVISGGRGLKSAENFKLLEVIADRLSGAIGASRAAVDAGFISNNYQVGQTGKIVAPELYIAVGISGAIQHLAGMKDSKCIVVINQDDHAPICEIADYILIGDLFKILPELANELDKMVK